MSRYQKGKTNLDFTEARDSEWQWHQLGHMQVCISLQTDNHASTPPLNHLTDSDKQNSTGKYRYTNSIQIRKSKQPKIQQNKTSLVQLPLTTLGQEMRWAYSTTLPSPHRATCKTFCSYLSCKSTFVSLASTSRQEQKDYVGAVLRRAYKCSQ